jgi:hypothetical protein
MSLTGSASMFRGEDVTLVYTLDPVVDCTGWAIEWTLSLLFGGTAVITKTASTASGSDGIFTVALARSDTLTKAVATYNYEARRTDDGSNAVLAIGTLRLRQ